MIIAGVKSRSIVQNLFLNLTPSLSVCVCQMFGLQPKRSGGHHRVFLLRSDSSLLLT